MKFDEDQDKELLNLLLKSKFISDRQYINIVAWILMILGGLGWAGGIIFATGGGGDTSGSVEFPLGDLSGIAVDSLGRIYCNLGFYSQVQQYDKTGTFLKSWSINSGGGDFKIRLNDKDELEVITARTDSLLRYNSDGVLLEEKHLDQNTATEIFASFHRQYRVETDEGIIYATNLLLLFPKIFRVTANGQSVTLVTVPFYKWLFMGPFPAWLFCVTSILLFRWKYQKPIDKTSTNVGDIANSATASDPIRSKQQEVDQRSYIDKLRGHRK